MIYGALLWYELISTTLSDLGFKINPYKRCISDKMINEKQCTFGQLVWFKKGSNTYNRINSIIAENSEEKFGKISPTTGKKHTFLGIDIDFIGGNKVAMTTPHQIDEALEAFGKTLKENVLNPTTWQPFTIIDEAKEPDDKKKERYH